MMKFVSLNDIQLHYIEKGERDRTALIFVHGSLNDYRSWQFQFERFAVQYHVIAYSRRNHYPNKWSDYPADYSVRTEGDDLVDFINALGLKTPVHIVGSSYGAFIAALVANDNPGLVRSLVIGEPPILSLLTEYGDKHVSELDSELEKRFAATVLKPLRNGDYDAAAQGFIDSLEGAGAFNRLPEETRRMMLANSRSLLAELTTPERDDFTLDDARKILAPTLLVEGRHTSPIYQTIIGILESSLPHATVATIEEASHTPHNTNPEAYNKAVLEFLSRH